MGSGGWGQLYFFKSILGKAFKGELNKMFDFLSKFFRKKKYSVERIDKTSQELIDFVSKSAFDMFRDDEFREQFNFSKQEKAEQDRLFNELSVTSLCLLLLVLDTVSNWWGNEKRYFWQRVKEWVPKRFQDWLGALGIPQKYVSIWGKLIKMRYEEYKEGLPTMYQAAGAADPKFIESNDEKRKTGYVRFMTISMGALYHLRKGKTGPKDPFFKNLRTWLEVLNSQLEEKIIKI